MTDGSAPYDSTADTQAHIEQVRRHLARVWSALEARALAHDASKLRPPEKDAFDAATPRLKALTFGSDAYKASLAELGDALNHHYAANRHHPEHHARAEGGVPDPDEVAGGEAIARMSLLDLIEMLCDWKAATERHADGDYAASLAVNRGRFGIGWQLQSVLVATAAELGFLPPDAGVPG